MQTQIVTHFMINLHMKGWKIFVVTCLPQKQNKIFPNLHEWFTSLALVDYYKLS